MIIIIINIIVIIMIINNDNNDYNDRNDDNDDNNVIIPINKLISDIFMFMFLERFPMKNYGVKNRWGHSPTSGWISRNLDMLDLEFAEKYVKNSLW